MKYAVGEIVLVVIGILIALALNNWNSERLDRKEEQRYLLSFKNEIQSQLNELDMLEKLLTRKIADAESLLAGYQRTESFAKIDSFNYKLSWLMGTSGFPNINTTFNEINSSGTIGIIQNDSVRASLINFYQKNDDYERGYHTNINNVFYPIIFPDFKDAININLKVFGYKSTQVNPDVVSKKQSEFLANKLEQPEVVSKLLNGLTLRMLFTNHNKMRVTDSKKLCIALLEQIDTELME